MAGIFDGQLRATGRLTDPDLSGNLWLPHFEYDVVHLDSISLKLYIQKIFSKRKGEATFRIMSGNINETPVNNVWIDAEIDSNLIHIPNINFRSEENYLDASLNIEFQSDIIKLIFPYFKIEYEKLK